jgi:DNA-binding NtrC family response regulator
LTSIQKPNIEYFIVCEESSDLATVTDKAKPKILLVDDNPQLRIALTSALEGNEFKVTAAANVAEALHLIDTEAFDVLLSNWHVPGAGDGFTVSGAMCHANPNAVTLVFTAHAALQEAMDAILLQADDIRLKPLKPPTVVAESCEKLQEHRKRRARNMRCEICKKREAVCNRLCESCADGIARLISIELPEKWPYEKGLYIVAAASTA